MKQSSDNSLIELVRSDNHLAFTVLVDRYWEDLYRHIWLRIKDDDEAKDMVQDIFMSLWKNRAVVTTDERGSVASYLFKAAKYTVINHFTRPGIIIADEAALALAVNFPSGSKTDGPFMLKELQGLLDIEVNNLPERLQVPYRLSREQQLTIREIAVRLSLSEQTVKNNISIALSKIRYRLGEYNSDVTICLALVLAEFIHRK